MPEKDEYFLIREVPTLAEKAGGEMPAAALISIPVLPELILRGGRGNLSLIVKPPSVTGVEVKLKPLGIVVSLQIWYTI